jgi:hypothetical protein
MSEPYEGMAALLSPLPDTFVFNETTLSPVIPPGSHGLMYYVASLAPVDVGFGKVYRDHTWNLAIISPVTGMEAARGPLLDALHEVIDVVEASDTARWTDATLEPFNDTLWCYSINITMYAENVAVQDEE